MLISELSSLNSLYNSGRIIDVIDWGTPPVNAQASYAPLRLPEKSSFDFLVYGVNLTGWIGDAGDRLATALITISPLGAPFDVVAGIPFFLDGNKAACILASGIPGTSYTVIFSVTTLLGKRASFRTSLFINFDTAATAPPVGLGMMLCPNLVATGTTIDDALPLECTYNIFSDIPLGSGAKLMPFPGPADSLGNPVPIVVVNPLVGGNTLLLYPPDVSVSINELAAGVPVQVPAPLSTDSIAQVSCIYEDSTHILAGIS